MIRFICILFIFCSTTYAQSIKLNIYHVRGPSSIGQQRLKHIVAQVVDVYNNQLGIDLIVNRFEKIKNPFTRFQLLKRRKRLIILWYKYFYRKNRQTKEINLLMLPPLSRPNKTLWFAGYAVTLCAINKYIPVAYVTGYLRNSGKYTNNILTTSITHEIGHLIGASHDESLPKTFMHPDPLSTLTETGPLKFSKKSKQEIYACLKGKL